jgi:hypothetical protein
MRSSRPNRSSCLRVSSRSSSEIGKFRLGLWPYHVVGGPARPHGQDPPVLPGLLGLRPPPAPTTTGWGASATWRGNEELQADLPELREGRPPALDPLQEVRRPDPGLTLMRMAECPRCRRPVRIRVLQAHFKMGVTDDTMEVNSWDAEVLRKCGRCGSRLPSVPARPCGGRPA